jgi:tRNA-binding protein
LRAGMATVRPIAVRARGWNDRAAQPGRAMATYAEFEALDIRVGTIVAAEPFPEARKPAIKLRIDFGAEIGVKRSSAQITKYYGVEDLVGRQVLAVVNFPPRQIGKFMSEVLTLGVPDDEGAVVLVKPDFGVANGGRLF